ncbi:MAG: hypothetical protein EFKGCFLK_00424 [Rhodocyclaceae bacterium]|nr:hypothetical protein [Zoogloeaceae bacterium]MBV6406876.1 hypothetical protein [Rhodocyclaceae bacterium]MCK6384830.1 hypothetical protein [Rhodocyclaceae bacterium]CAG0933442.1 hypothetical protein RHDC3_02571 [Rhodocyclaceae bacterium]
MAAPKPALKLPPAFFALSTAASLFLAGGVLGLFAPRVLPALASPPVAWSLIGVGVTFEAWAVAILIGTARRNAAGR